MCTTCSSLQSILSPLFFLECKTNTSCVSVGRGMFLMSHRFIWWKETSSEKDGMWIMIQWKMVRPPHYYQTSWRRRFDQLLMMEHFQSSPKILPLIPKWRSLIPCVKTVSFCSSRISIIMAIWLIPRVMIPVSTIQTYVRSRGTLSNGKPNICTKTTPKSSRRIPLSNSPVPMFTGFQLCLIPFVTSWFKRWNTLANGPLDLTKTID